MMMKHSFEALDHAFELAKGKKYEEALRICNNFILNWPHAYAGYYRKSNILGMMGRHDDALRALDKVAELPPDRAFPYFARAEHHRKTGNYQRAIEDYTKAQKRDNGFFGHEIPLYRAECHLRAGDLEGALQACQEVPDDYRSPGFRGHREGSKHLVLADIAKAMRG